MEDEIFKTITNFNDYEISNLGNIRKKGCDELKEKFVLKQYGYHFIELINSDNQSKKLPVKRLVAKHFFTDFDDKKHIIHIDNKLDDNINNLRYSSHKENTLKAKISKNNTSGIKGVSFHKSTNKWAAQITINKKQFYLGSFENIEDAQSARIKKENEFREELGI